MRNPEDHNIRELIFQSKPVSPNKLMGIIFCIRSGCLDIKNEYIRKTVLRWCVYAEEKTKNSNLKECTEALSFLKQFIDEIIMATEEGEIKQEIIKQISTKEGCVKKVKKISITTEEDVMQAKKILEDICPELELTNKTQEDNIENNIIVSRKVVNNTIKFSNQNTSFKINNSHYKIDNIINSPIIMIGKNIIDNPIKEIFPQYTTGQISTTSNGQAPFIPNNKLITKK